MKLVPPFLALLILALLVLASAATAEEVIVYSVPEGADASRVATLLGRHSDWPDTPDTKELRRQTRLHHFTHAKGQIRIRLTADLSDTELKVLDAAVRRCYAQYRKGSLESIEEIRANREHARRRADEVRDRMRQLYATSLGVLDKERALAASAERVEELRRRTVDAGIEVAVIEARLGALRDQIAKRGKLMREAALAPLLAEEKRLVHEQGLGENHGAVIEIRSRIKWTRDARLVDDEEFKRARSRVAELEVEQIATEERIRALSAALRSARELGGKLLDAVDLSEYRRKELRTAEEAVEGYRTGLERLDSEFRALTSDAMPERVPVKRR